jgi:hypothetical protein
MKFGILEATASNDQNVDDDKSLEYDRDVQPEASWQCGLVLNSRLRRLLYLVRRRLQLPLHRARLLILRVRVSLVKLVAAGTIAIGSRVKLFACAGDLTKHFKRKHLSNIREGDCIKCKVCLMTLEHKMHLQNHAFTIHGTIS